MPHEGGSGRFGYLSFGSEEDVLLVPGNSAASAFQQLCRPVETLAPSAQFRGVVPCRGTETEFRVECTLLPDLTALSFSEFRAIACHYCMEFCSFGPLGDLLQDSEVDSEDLLFGISLLPHGEIPQMESHAEACAVTLCEPPYKKLHGRFVPPELRTSRDRRCFRLFNEHICQSPLEKTSGNGRNSLVGRRLCDRLKNQCRIG